MESEWRWFRASVADALAHPRRFASGLAREHYGLAGVLVALGAGIALSIAVDVAVVTSKGADPLALLTRLAVDAFFLGVRLLVVIALIALLAVGAARLVRRDITLDQSFTALSFATAPLLLSPAAVVCLLVATDASGPLRTGLLAAAAALALALVSRVVFTVVLNLAALVHRAAIVVAGVALLAGALVLQDQIGRVSFTALAYAPGILPPPAAVPATGQRVEVIDLSFAVPPAWQRYSSGAPGIAAQYELPDARLIVRTAGVSPVTTADAFAAAQAETERRDFTSIERTERRVVRVDSAVATADLWRGRIGATPLTERLYTFVVGARGYVFEFLFYSPEDEAAELGEAAAIAASITIAR